MYSAISGFFCCFLFWIILYRLLFCWNTAFSLTSIVIISSNIPIWFRSKAFTDSFSLSSATNSRSSNDFFSALLCTTNTLTIASNKSSTCFFTSSYALWYVTLTCIRGVRCAPFSSCINSGANTSCLNAPKLRFEYWFSHNSPILTE